MTQNIIDNRIHMLSDDDSRVTYFTTAKFSNDDFVVVQEQKVGDLYYICVTKYNSNMETIIPSFYVKNAEGAISAPSNITPETESLFASSTLPMNPAVTPLQSGEFVIGFFQMPYLSITLKKYGIDGYSKNLYASNDALGQYPLGDPQTWDIHNLPDDRHWEENVPMSLSLLGFNDNRFLVAWTTSLWPLPCQPIGVPTNRLVCEKGDAPYKASVSISTYNSDGSIFEKQRTVSITGNQDENVDFYTSTALRMLDPTNNIFVVSYYLQQELIVKTFRYNPNTALQYAERFFDKSVFTTRPFVQIGLYPFGSNILPIFFYESINRTYYNIQSFMDVKLTDGRIKSTLIGDDNTQGQYNDRDPNKCVLSDGTIKVTWHRYNAKDDSSLGLFVQHYTFYVTPTDLIVNRLTAPQCFDNTEHSLGPFMGGNNIVNCVVEKGTPYFFELDPTQGAIYIPGQCNPSESSTLVDPSIGNKPIGYTHALVTLTLALFIITGLSSLVFYYSRRVFSYQRLSEASEDVELATINRANEHRTNTKFLTKLFGVFSEEKQLIISSNQTEARKSYQATSEMKL